MGSLSLDVLSVCVRLKEKHCCEWLSSIFDASFSVARAREGDPEKLFPSLSAGSSRLGRFLTSCSAPPPVFRKAESLYLNGATLISGGVDGAPAGLASRCFGQFQSSVMWRRCRAAGTPDHLLASGWRS